MALEYSPSVKPTTVLYQSEQVSGLNIAYRKAGDPGHPKLLLLHGLPSSSYQ